MATELELGNINNIDDSVFKDLGNLREQLYSAADYFESAYQKEHRNHFVLDSSKEYVGKAVVSTVDHLGCVADKLTKLLGHNLHQFSATNLRFSFIQQRLNTFQEFSSRRGVSQHLLMIEPSGDSFGRHKRYYIPESNLDSSTTDIAATDDVQPPQHDTPFSKNSIAARTASREPSTNAYSFSFTKVTANKRPSKHAASPLRFPLKMSESFIKRSVSPSPSTKNQLCISEPRRAISACRGREMANREIEVESHAKRSAHLFKALLNVHRSRKDAVISRQHVKFPPNVFRA
ncbi:protein ABIL4-like isoform X2 [Andrographis paniculata]|uniref:protein ABIL4-like isoform X2 n=1 Tax=Andrographis paniculata TaxID=175694 RepID=UPI0021E826F5|nr:protein ABIL4-like isoform X2 [Andrographis paniculata]